MNRKGFELKKYLLFNSPVKPGEKPVFGVDCYRDACDYATRLGYAVVSQEEFRQQQDLEARKQQIEQVGIFQFGECQP